MTTTEINETIIRENTIIILDSIIESMKQMNAQFDEMIGILERGENND